MEKHREHLEELVEERTAALEEKTAKIERLNKLFVDRELRMKELKERIKELEKKLEVRSWEFGVRRKKDSSCKLQAKNLRLET